MDQGGTFVDESTSLAIGDIVTLTICGLSRNLRYNYSVQAFNAFGPSDLSNPVEIGTYIMSTLYRPGN